MKHETSFYAPLNMSIEEAKRAAIEQAKTEAITEAFGEIISSHMFSDVMALDGQEIDNFQMLSSSISKGIWIQDIEKPKFEEPEILESQKTMVIKVTVHGKVREIVSTPIDLKIALLRNAADLRNEENSFREGDDLFIYFHSPEDGFLIVYVAGNNGIVQTLLPLEDNGGSVHINANREYMFFGADDEFSEGFNGLTLTCDGSVEYNRFYFVFSTNPISKARDSQSNSTVSEGLVLPRELSEKDFRKWLVNNMDHDKNLNVVIRDIRIANKNTMRRL
ncbi:MAG: hypothetical protein KBT20_11835 [Bacteroidales bacterium]|nr:hypothetical protein [Candidatus Liminaster caballi]